MKFEKLGDIVTIKKGRKPLLTEFPNEKSIRVLQIDDLRNDDNIKYTDELNGVLAGEEDILIAWDGANAGTIGFGKTGYIGSTIAVLKKKNPDKYSTTFIGKFLQSQFDFLRKSATGATIPHIDRKSLEGLLLPRISLPDQIRVAEILTKAENLIIKRRESISLADELLKNKFLEMFGDPVVNEKGWETDILSKLGSLDRGVSKHRPRNAPELLGGDYPLIQTGEVSNAGIYLKNYTKTYSELGLKQSKLWEEGTLLITIAANIAQTSILTFKACFPDSIVGFIPNKNISNTVYVHFLFSFFQSILEKNAPKAAQKNINLDLLRNLIVPIPPMEIQNHFASIVEKIESIKTQYSASLFELENMHSALSQKAFDGQFIQHEFIEEKKELIMEEYSAEKMNLDQFSNIEKKERIDITNITYAEYLGIPEELIATREKWIFDFLQEEEFYQFLLKDNFKDKEFTLHELEMHFHDFFYHGGDMDFDNAQWKEIIFKFLEKDPPLLEQFFDEKSATIKLKLTNEAYQA